MPAQFAPGLRKFPAQGGGDKLHDDKRLYRDGELLGISSVGIAGDGGQYIGEEAKDGEVTFIAFHDGARLLKGVVEERPSG